MIPLLKVFMPEDVNGPLLSILHSGALAYGSYVVEFEHKVSAFIGNKNFLATNSFNSSMLIALQLAGVGIDDEVIVSPMSCLAANQPIVSRQAKVVWADIDPATGTLDPYDVARKITSKTKAIVHYHWAGYPGYIDEINLIAKEASIKVIEDASEAFAAEYKGKRIGNTGSDMVCFSFQTIRLPNTVDGGGIAFNDENLYQKCILTRDYGIDRSKFRDQYGEIRAHCDIEIEGYGATMNNPSGYIGSMQMNCLPGLLDKQTLNGAAWDMLLANSETAQSLKLRGEIKPNYWVYCATSTSRDKLLHKFRNQGLYASKLHLRNDVYSVFGNLSSHLPGVSNFSDTILCLPSGWWFSFADQMISL